MKIKNCIAAFVVTLFLTSTLAYAEKPITVVVNGADLQSNVAPIIVEGRTLVPLRPIFEALGVVPVWNGGTKTVTAQTDTVKMSLTIGVKECSVNNKPVLLEVAGTLVNGSTMVPARFIAETFGATVSWDAGNQAVLISTKQEKRGKPIGNYGSNLVDDGYLFTSSNYGPVTKSGLDGSNPVVLLDGLWGGSYMEGLDMPGSSFTNMNVMDGWLYYTQQKTFDGEANLYKAKNDGTQQKLLASGDVKSVEVVEDAIYYITEDGKLYRMTLDGGDQKLLTTTDTSSEIKVTGGWVYFREYKEISEGVNEFSISKVKTDGSQKSLIAKNNGIGSWTIANGWIYYSLWDKGSIYKMKTDGTALTKISDIHAGDLKISGNWIFFREENTGFIQRMKLDGTGLMPITKQVTSYNFELIGDYVYYDTHEPMLPYRAKADGSNIERMITAQ